MNFLSRADFDSVIGTRSTKCSPDSRQRSDAFLRRKRKLIGKETFSDRPLIISNELMIILVFHKRHVVGNKLIPPIHTTHNLVIILPKIKWEAEADILRFGM